MRMNTNKAALIMKTCPLNMKATKVNIWLDRHEENLIDEGSSEASIQQEGNILEATQPPNRRSAKETSPPSGFLDTRRVASDDFVTHEQAIKVPK